MSNLRKILTLSLILALLGSASTFVYASEKTIPSTMPAGTILTYDEQLNPTITVDEQMQKSRITNVEKDIGSAEDLLAEEAVYQKIKKDAKDNEVVSIPYELPAPSEGMIVIYGSDGQINRIYSPETKITPFASVPNEGKALPYPSRLSPNTYEYGSYPNVTTITSSHVLGEGRFTVYRAGVGGSGSIGSSGKTLGTGDVATKQSVDNAKHNTALRARATSTNVLKTVYKNDIGYMGNSVLDVYFWGVE